MKKIFLAYIILIIGVSGVVVYMAQKDKLENINSSVTIDIKEEVALPEIIEKLFIDISKSKILTDDSYHGLMPGTSLPALTLIDDKGDSINLHQIEQKLLIYHQGYSVDYLIIDLLAHSSSRYKEEIQFVVTFAEKPDQQMVDMLVEQGVIVIPQYKEMNKYTNFKQLNLRYLYLVNEEKQIVMRKLRVNYAQMDEILKSFVADGNIPKEYNYFGTLQFGEKAPEFPKLPEVNGGSYALGDFQGKISMVIKATGSGAKYQEILNQVTERYKGEINVILVFNDQSEKFFKGVQDTYSFIGKPLPEVYTNFESRTFEEQATLYAGKENYYSLYDEYGVLDELWNLENDTFVLLDIESRVFEAFVLTTTATSRDAKELIIQSVNELMLTRGQMKNISDYENRCVN